MSGRRSGSLTARANPNNNGLASIIYTDADGTKPADVTNAVQGGELGGKINAGRRVERRPRSARQFSLFLVEEVNNQHRAGFSLSVGGNPPTDQQNFFSAFGGVPDRRRPSRSTRRCLRTRA